MCATLPENKLLIVHTGGGLGDILLSRPVVQAFADWQVDFLCRSSTQPALQGHPGIHQLWTWSGKGPGGLKAWWHWVSQLKAEHYDAAILLWSTSATAWMLWAAGIPRRIGQNSRLSYSFLFTDRVRVRSEHGDEDSHWSDILLDYARVLKPQAHVTPVQIPVGPNPWQEGPYLALHAFKGPPVELKRWPLQVFADWARALHQHFELPVVLTGSPSEAPWAEKIAHLAGPGVVNWAGKTDLQGLAALAAGSQAFICPDSGPMHVAAAAGAKVLGIYALQEDFPQRWAPLTPTARILRPQPTGCRPGCRKPTCPDFRCYHSVRPEQVVAEVEKLMATASPDAAPPPSADSHPPTGQSQDSTPLDEAAQ